MDALERGLGLSEIILLGERVTQNNERLGQPIALIPGPFGESIDLLLHGVVLALVVRILNDHVGSLGTLGCGRSGTEAFEYLKRCLTLVHRKQRLGLEVISLTDLGGSALSVTLHLVGARPCGSPVSRPVGGTHHPDPCSVPVVLDLRFLKQRRIASERILVALQIVGQL